MEPILIQPALLIRIAADTSRNSLWRWLQRLVRRPTTGESAEPELAAFEESPADPRLARELIGALVRRAAQEPEFGADLERWGEVAEDEGGRVGSVTNTISGGTFQGSVIQGRDFHGVNIFNASPAAGPSNGDQ
ncbi:MULTISPECIES: hypothetical protein [unclassified Streptomyces]|uniref:hypothetical protein n=1 Tax=unclassified Streptomyces TaxID=2593676 RepID=UPI002E284CFA|nr:hypothetical protein [Streptomyces sp. NBC_01439]